MPVKIVHRLVDEFVLVSEEELRAAIRLYVEKAHNRRRGWSRTARRGSEDEGQLTGKRVGLVLSGGNLTVSMLREILA